MRYLLIIASVVLAAAGLSSAKVLDLTDSDFDAQLERHDVALVMFYAPWCGHCKKLKPDFEEAGKVLAKNDPPVQLAKIDCTEAGKSICSRFEVQGYPTLKIFNNGESSKEYDGPRNVKGIVDYMKRRAAPALKELSSQSELESLLDSSESVVVAGFLSEDTQIEEFKKLAEQMRDTTSFVTSKKPLGSRKEGVYLFRPKFLRSKLEDFEVKYEGDVTKSNLKKWIRENQHGLVGYKTPDNDGDFETPLVMAYYSVDYAKNAKGTNYWRNRVLKVAAKFPKLNFAIANQFDYKRETEAFGMADFASDKAAPMVGVKSKDGKKYVMSEEFSVDNLEKFLKDYEAGKIEPFMKSEPIPDNTDKAVKVGVGKNLDELVMQNKKDVLVEFYAPWCGHCKSLEPVYAELGEAMKDEDVEIVKVDATANDFSPEFSVNGFPSIFWYPADTKKVEKYEGGRDLDDFVKFIAKKASTPLKNYDSSGNKKKTEL